MKSHTSVVTFFSTSIGVRRADQQGSATFVPKLIVSEAGAIELVVVISTPTLICRLSSKRLVALASRSLRHRRPPVALH